MEVKVYTTTHCPNCKVLKRLLDGNNVKFESINLEENPDALNEMVEATNQRTVPVTKVNGEWIVGMDMVKLSKALGL